jgi:hypothetical protein
MKNPLFVLLLLAPCLLMAQPDFTPLVDAARRGDANALAAQMDAVVQMSILDEDNRLPKASAASELSAFFAKNKPTGCTVVNKGMSDDKLSHFCICSLATTGGTFRLYFYLRQNAGKFLIREIRIEK